MADTGITRAEMEEVLEEFLPKLINSIEHSNYGKASFENNTNLKTMLDAIKAIVKNTGPDGTMSPSNFADAIVQADQKNRNLGKQPDDSSKPFNRKDETKKLENSDNKTILEAFDKNTASSSQKFSASILSAADKIKTFGKVLSLATIPFSKLYDQIQKNDRMYSSLIQSGTAWSGSATKMASDINSAGLQVDTFVKMMNESNLGIRSIGGAQYLQYASQIGKATSKLGDFGLGVDDYQKQFSNYVEILRIQGNTQELNQKNLGESFHDLLGKTISLTSQFGVSVDAFMKAQQNLQKDVVQTELIARFVQRTGGDASQVEHRVETMQAAGVSAEYINSVLRMGTGIVDPFSAVNRGLVGASVNALSQRSDSNYFRGMNRAAEMGNAEGSRVFSSLADAGSFTASQNSILGSIRTGVEVARSLRGIGAHYQENNRSIVNQSGAGRAFEGSRWTMENMAAYQESTRNALLKSFDSAIEQGFTKFNTTFIDSYKHSIDNVNYFSDKLKSLGDWIGDFIKNHGDGATSIAGTLMGYAGAAGAIGAGGLLTGGLNSLRKRVLRNHRNNVIKNSVDNMERNANGSILENAGADVEEVASKSNKISGLSKLSRFRGIGKAVPYLGLALGALDIYNGVSEANHDEASGKISSDEADRKKWETWGSGIGGAAGGAGGALLGSGILSAFTGVAGYYGGNYIGSKVGDLGYDIDKWWNRPSTNQPDISHNNGNVNTHENQVQTTNQKDELSSELKQLIEQSTIQTNILRNMVKALGNMSPYTH